MKVHKNRKSMLVRAGLLFCGALLMALWAEIAVQAQNAPVVKTPAQVAEEEAVRRQEAVKQINTYLISRQSRTAAIGLNTRLSRATRP
jgi:hypothetical protein